MNSLFCKEFRWRDAVPGVRKTLKHGPRGRGLSTLLAAIILATSTLQAEVSLSKMFSNNMVLQRELPVAIWGQASPAEAVTVAFAGQDKSTKADKDGNWRVLLDPLETSSQGLQMLVRGPANEITLNNILVGEVWLCAGQSNMAGRFGKSQSIPKEAFKHGLKRMRFHDRKDWDDIDEKSQRRLSRVAFFFGYELYKDLDVPIGLIPRHNGGTPVQAWMSAADAEEIRVELGIEEHWREEVKKKQRGPGYQYNDKIKHVIPFTFRGVIWYQGERNAKAQTAWEYDRLFTHFIESWRKDWGERAGLPARDFPFYFVQIPTDIHIRGYEFPWVRDRQRRSLELVENTGMAIFWEEGPGLHPADKSLAGKRLSLLAFSRTYGRKGIVDCGPLLDDVIIKGDQAHLSFTHIGSGLKERNGKSTLDYFEVAGADLLYHPANARIDGDTVVVSSPEENEPKYVRYLFNVYEGVTESAEGAKGDEGSGKFSLMNAEGIPASSFITDDAKPFYRNH
jgi:sialate O-acetylesterase